jgi:iron(III) transport system permease protein
MSQSFARIVFAVTAVFFAAFFVWPLCQILKGGFIDADGHLTLAYIGALLSEPTHPSGSQEPK